MRVVVLVMMFACGKPTSPNAPVMPDLPPATPVAAHDDPHPTDKPAIDVDKIVWPAFPELAAIPANAPTGAQIVVPKPAAPKIGDKLHRSMNAVFETHSTTKHQDSRYQKTKTTFEIDQEVSGVTGGSITQLKITGTGQEQVALANAPTDTLREDMPLISGAYTISANADGRIDVTGANGTREVEELQGIYTGELAAKYTPVDFVREKKLRAGEVITLDDRDRAALGGGDLKDPDFKLALVSADANRAVFQIDGTSTAQGMWTTGQATIRVQFQLTFDRKTGRLLEQQSRALNREKDADSFSDEYHQQLVTFTYR
ncbi:MAG: hypothetical protein QM831_06190 [Kofleriaceae bacterium]